MGGTTGDDGDLAELLGDDDVGDVDEGEEDLLAEDDGEQAYDEDRPDADTIEELLAQDDDRHGEDEGHADGDADRVGSTAANGTGTSGRSVHGNGSTTQHPSRAGEPSNTAGGHGSGARGKPMPAAYYMNAADLEKPESVSGSQQQRHQRQQPGGGGKGGERGGRQRSGGRGRSGQGGQWGAHRQSPGPHMFPQGHPPFPPMMGPNGMMGPGPGMASPGMPGMGGMGPPGVMRPMGPGGMPPLGPGALPPVNMPPILPPGAGMPGIRPFPPGPMPPPGPFPGAPAVPPPRPPPGTPPRNAGSAAQGPGQFGGMPSILRPPQPATGPPGIGGPPALLATNGVQGPGLHGVGPPAGPNGASGHWAPGEARGPMLVAAQPGWPAPPPGVPPTRGGPRPDGSLTSPGRRGRGRPTPPPLPETEEPAAPRPLKWVRPGAVVPAPFAPGADPPSTDAKAPTASGETPEQLQAAKEAELKHRLALIEARKKEQAARRAAAAAAGAAGEPAQPVAAPSAAGSQGGGGVNSSSSTAATAAALLAAQEEYIAQLRRTIAMHEASMKAKGASGRASSGESREPSAEPPPRPGASAPGHKRGQSDAPAPPSVPQPPQAKRVKRGVPGPAREQGAGVANGPGAVNGLEFCREADVAPSADVSGQEVAYDPSFMHTEQPGGGEDFCAED